jgi:hypothetical protein
MRKVLCPYVSPDNLRPNRWSFMKLDTNVVTLEIKPLSYFLISYHQQYQHGRAQFLRGS